MSTLSEDANVLSAARHATSGKMELAQHAEKLIAKGTWSLIPQTFST
jgi:hypothetical protein